MDTAVDHRHNIHSHDMIAEDTRSHARVGLISGDCACMFVMSRLRTTVMLIEFIGPVTDEAAHASAGIGANL